MNDQFVVLDQARSTLIDLAIRFGPKLVVALLILVVGFFVGRWLGRLTEGMLEKLAIDAPVRQLLVRLLRLLVLGLFLIMALQNLGVELLPLIAGLGVAGAGIALAMQGVLGNLVAGLTIIFTRPFRIGEYIAIVGEEGSVEEISLFKTVLSHPDRSRVVIPNRKIVGEILHNYGEIRQLEVAVGVAYDTDLNRALALIRAILAANPRLLHDPEALIQVRSLADSGVVIAVKPWAPVAEFHAATGELNQAILERFRADGIVIPFPQREVRLLGRPD
ncbi:MAG: small conductance mechanosensitive channel [bacterium]|nr:MAG: small conductance mechanosensitive channel [bacterium]KAF0149074.1 MAG: small conductance mechanosensitive channel [bacterium]KAF0168434.1 MAG: small conductance mechanosensitive channel [bacterium]TXT20817.1 MAG: small conductance mechanosensitive channel [bacterium]